MTLKGLFRRGKDQDASLGSPKPGTAESASSSVQAPVIDQMPPAALASALPEPGEREVAPLPMQDAPTSRYAPLSYAPVPAEVAPVAPLLVGPTADVWASLMISALLMTARIAAGYVQVCVQDRLHAELQQKSMMETAERQLRQGDVTAARRTVQRHLRQGELLRIAEVRLGAALDLQERTRQAQQEALTLRDLATAGEGALLEGRVQVLTTLFEAISTDQAVWAGAEAQVPAGINRREHWETEPYRQQVEDALSEVQARVRTGRDAN